MDYLVTTFYKFIALSPDQLDSIKYDLETRANGLGLLGLVLIAPEGINATISGEETAINQYKQWLNARFGQLVYKDSISHTRPFKRFKVKIKPEIVQLKQAEAIPSGQEAHLSPQEWDQFISEEDVVLIDVRNVYEVKLGTFKKAINPKTWKFNQFPRWLKKASIPKQQKIGIFCTGGIRCEKAAVVMKEQGYEQVYQLDGGILNYIADRPHRNFEGECFVFDARVTVGQDLRPSQQYSLCVNCGNGGSIKEQCVLCHTEYRTCDDCVVKTPTMLCSRNCRYIYARDYKTA